MPKPTHILVIRLSAMGDVAMTLPVLRVFSATYPLVKITVVSIAFFKPLFTELPNVHFFSAEVNGKHKGIKGVLKLARELDKEGIDGVADLHNVLRSKLIKTYFRVNNIPTAEIDKGRAEKRALTRKNNKHFVPLSTTIERYAIVFETLGFPVDLHQHQFPKRKELLPSLSPFIDSAYKNHIGIAPFAAFEGKMYPLALMEEVIQWFDATKETQIFLFGGGKQETEKLQLLAEKFPSVINMSGILCFKEELSLISNLDIMLAMDSGNAHLAAIYNIPTITLWGVTHPYAGFYPFGQLEENALLADRSKFPLIPTSIYGNRFPKGYEKAIQTITPQEVIKKMVSILEKN